MVVSPFGPLGGIVALSLFPMALATVMATITIVGRRRHCSACRCTGRPCRSRCRPSLLGLCAFLPLALLLAGAVLIVKQAGSIANFLITGLAFASGSFFPVSVLPSALRWISDVQPLTPALELIRHELVGTADLGLGVGGGREARRVRRRPGARCRSSRSRAQSACACVAER